jgi:hypothetical protein
MFLSETIPRILLFSSALLIRYYYGVQASWIALGAAFFTLFVMRKHIPRNGNAISILKVLKRLFPSQSTTRSLSTPESDTEKWVRFTTESHAFAKQYNNPKCRT